MASRAVLRYEWLTISFELGAHVRVYYEVNMTSYGGNILLTNWFAPGRLGLVHHKVKRISFSG